MHLFPQLRKLERRFPDEVAVIGVHAAKFHSERETDVIRYATLRYGIEHPVVNDRDFWIWQNYGVRAWPTLVFIDPRGKVIGHHSGELPWPTLEHLVGQMIEEFDAAGLLDRRPLEFALERADTGLLAFPGKLLVNGSRIFIADSNHHRIVVAGLDGAVQHMIGGPEPGLRDGDYSQARFDRPQGLALDGDRLFVADTENHAIRAVDLTNQMVLTLAGTGEQAIGYPPKGGPARRTALSSPWDLVLLEDLLFIAMAGCHQLWVLDTKQSLVGPIAGAGPEGLQDGPLTSAYLAQPSGITSDGETLYFADSETSSIRKLTLGEPGTITTLVGKDLFVFGDMDGTGDDVLLQHPLGVHAAGDQVFLADSFNNKIKRLDPATRTVVTIAGSGLAGHADGAVLEAQFSEPGGLWAANGKLYVADTNNHAIRIIDLAAGQVSTLALRD